MTRHEENRVLPYMPEQLYDLVADIEKYPEFLPWCQAARIRRQNEIPEGQIVEADLVIAFLAFREKFGSRVTLSQEKKTIQVEYLDGPFHKLENSWHFHEHEAGCEVAFFVEFSFKNRILEIAIGKVFDQAMRRIVAAFEDRAAKLYGS